VKNDNKFTIFLCMARERWSGCRMKKNLCCAKCESREDCMIDYSINFGNKKRPCDPDDIEDCDFLETIT